jgi:hypothetical protein
MTLEQYQEALKRERKEDRTAEQSAEPHGEIALPVCPPNSTLLSMRIRRERAAAEKIEMMNRQLIAELVPLEQLRAFSRRCLTMFSAELVHRIASEKNPSIISAILDTHVRQILHNIAENRTLWEAPLLLLSSEADAP